MGWIKSKALPCDWDPLLSLPQQRCPLRIFKLRQGASIIPNVGRSVENFKITGFRGLTCLNLKTNLARYTNKGVISIPSRNRFLVWESLKKVGHPGTWWVSVSGD